MFNSDMCESHVIGHVQCKLNTKPVRLEHSLLMLLEVMLSRCLSTFHSESTCQMKLEKRALGGPKPYMYV